MREWKVNYKYYKNAYVRPVYADNAAQAKAKVRRELRSEGFGGVKIISAQLVGGEHLKTYGELDMKAIREACGLDFAHYTYKPGMCSCCFGPQDLPKRYWKDGIVREDTDFTFILGKNADNGSGYVQKDDPIVNDTCFEHFFRDEAQKEKVCRMLAAQLGPNYKVAVPKSDHYCIVVYERDKAKIDPNFYFLKDEQVVGDDA